jgi:hypothetical protein
MIAPAVAILIKLAQRSPVSLSHWLSRPVDARHRIARIGHIS